MKFKVVVFAALFFSSAARADDGMKMLNFETFGSVAVYGDATKPGPFALILDDKSVPDAATAAIAKNIADRGALAAVVDFDAYLDGINKRGDYCAYHSWEFEKLSKYVQKTLDRPSYQSPLIVGLGDSGALAYTTITESPRGTFAGLFVAGFCPVAMPSKNLCANEDETWEKAAGLAINLKATDSANEPWVVLPTARAQCATDQSADFFSDTDNAKILPITKASWGAEPWALQVGEAIWQQILSLPVQTQTNGIGGLPVVEQRAEKRTSKTLAIMVTGDGGWAGIDREIADLMNIAGLDVVGFNSLEFFWRKRTPEETAQALSRVIEDYTSAWKADGVILVGYSFGADIAPFVVKRLSDDNLRALKAVALLAPGLETHFEFRVTDWLGLGEDPGVYKIVAEIQAMPKVPLLCVYGQEEADEGVSACPKFSVPQAKIVKTAGGHHFDGNYDAIARNIIALIQPSSTR